MRAVIKKSSPLLQERIKWNAPSYYIREDLFTFGPYRNNRLLLVFHHPAIVKISSPLLEGSYKDRRLLYITGSKDAADKAKELTRVIRELIRLSGNT